MACSSACFSSKRRNMLLSNLSSVLMDLSERYNFFKIPNDCCTLWQHFRFNPSLGDRELELFCSATSFILKEYDDRVEILGQQFQKNWEPSQMYYYRSQTACQSIPTALYNPLFEGILTFPIGLCQSSFVYSRYHKNQTYTGDRQWLLQCSNVVVQCLFWAKQKTVKTTP